MAFPTTIFGSPADVKKETTVQYHPLGTRLVLADGRVFRYAKNISTALALGKLCSASLADSDEFEDLTPLAAVTTAATNATITVDYSTASQTMAANKFKDGYMFVNVGTGAGQIIQIKQQDAGGSTADGTVKVYFEDENYLSVALDSSSSKVGFVQNPYDGVTVCPVATAGVSTQMPIGVTTFTVSLGSSTPYYFWLQTWGPCAVLSGDTPAVGESQRTASSSGAAGEIMSYQVATSATGNGAKIDLPQIGIILAGSADAEYNMVFLTLSA